MNQLLHILRKDVRHFYPEILLNLALLSVYAWSTAYVASSIILSPQYGLIFALLRLLLPIAWLLLVLRVVCDEAMAGDRQFWITRPYRRMTLLSEKVVFLLLFLNLPVLLMQACLLAKTELPIAPSLLDLLHLQGAFFCLLVLPMLAIATVSRTLGQGLLWTVGVAVLVIVTTVSTSLVHPGQIVVEQTISTAMILLVGTLLLVVVSMYARRPVWKCRAVLIALPLLLAAVVALSPTGWLLRHTYAANTKQNALILATKSGKPQVADQPVTSEWAHLTVPVLDTTLPAGQESYVQSVQIALRNAQDSWESAPLVADATLTSGQAGTLFINLPGEIFRRFQGSSVDMELHAFVKRYTFDSAQTVTVDEHGRFQLSSGAMCVVYKEGEAAFCRNALRQLPTEKLTFELQDETCSTTGDKTLLTRRTDGSTPSTLSMELNPVVQRHLSFQEVTGWSEGQTERVDQQVRHRYLCPGAHIAVQEQRLLGQQQLTMQANAIHLADFLSGVRTTGTVAGLQD